MRPILFVALLATASSTAAQAPTFNTPAVYAYMKDLSSNSVLYSKDADTRIPPASMGKMMSVYVAFSLIKRGEASLDQKIMVRPETWTKWHSQGSTMFLSANEQVSVENLLHGIVTLSGNDACVVLAEGLGGTEENYVALMNQAAKKIGLKNSHFANTNGWPDPNEYVTARDLAMIAEATIRDFPDLYKRFYAKENFTWGKTLGKGDAITQPNRNPLLGKIAGADGLKTGHTEEAGYGLVGSAVQNGRRVILVITGMGSEALREEEAQRLITWAFREFEDKKLFKGSDVVATAEVWLGTEALVGMTTKGDLGILVPHGSSDKIALHVAYAGPVEAPIAAGQELGTLVVDIPNMGQRTYPLVAANAVARGGFLTRLNASAHLLGNRILALSGQDGQ